MSDFRYVVKPSVTPSVPSEPNTEAGSADDTASEQPPPAKKRRRGQNKHRPRPAMLATSDMLCSYLYSPNKDSTTKCPFGDRCRYMHDLQSFMDTKPPDISENCYLFESYGKCPYGIACRYGAKHLTVDLKNIVNDDLYDSARAKSTFNVLSKTLQEQLRKRTFEFVRSEAHLCRIKQPVSKETTVSTHVNSSLSADLVQLAESVPAQENCVAARCTVSEDVPLGGETAEGVIKLRPAEKKKVGS